jgi:hypothetical protein
VYRRYAVVYRLLHGVLVIVVSRSHANVFANLNLVASISRLLVAELKSVEITPERVLKRYAQVGVGIDQSVHVDLCAVLTPCPMKGDHSLSAYSVGKAMSVTNQCNLGRVCVWGGGGYPVAWGGMRLGAWASWGTVRARQCLLCSACMPPTMQIALVYMRLCHICLLCAVMLLLRAADCHQQLPAAHV